MALVSRTIPNLVQGVSQQPEVLRLNSQASEQVNGFSSVVEGLKKRPSTSHVAKISTTTYSNAFIHTYNRDGNEKYTIIIDGSGTVKVFDTVNGQEETVHAQQVNNSNAYFTSSNPKEDFRAVTVADYTFIVNKTKTTGFLPLTSTSDNYVRSVSLLEVESVKNSGTITVNHRGTSRTTTLSSSATIQNTRDRIYNTWINHIPTSGTFASNISPLSLYKIGSSGLAWIRTNTSGTTTFDALNADNYIKVTDSFGDKSCKVTLGSVNRFSDLPANSVSNHLVKVTGDGGTAFDDYYVKYQNNQSLWVESRLFKIPFKLDFDVMPHVLVRLPNQSFALTPCDGDYSFYDAPDYLGGGNSVKYDAPKWGDRLVGDELSAPQPTFIGRKINDIFFHRNRLGFLSDENVIMSRAGEFFEFFPETVTQTLSTDPIDVASTHTKVSILKNAVSFDEEMLLFSDQTQFTMSSPTGTLSSENLEINVASEYETDNTVEPVSNGNTVIFAFKKGGFTGFREYFVDSDTDTKKSDDITGNVPKYVPKNVFKITTTTNENIMCALSSDEVNALYVYQSYFQGGKRVQSAWHKWTFGTTSTDRIVNIEFIENELFIINARSDGTYIEKIDVSPALTDTGEDYLNCLDRKVDQTDVTMSYDSGTDRTTITLPYTITNTMRLIGKSSATDLKGGQNVATVSQSGTDIVVSGDLTSSEFFIGEEYEFKFVFSQQFIQVADTVGSRISVKEGRLQIRKWEVSYNDTGFFKTKVEPVGRASSETTFTGTVTGSGILGTVNLEDGEYEFAVQSENDKLKISLTSDSHLPCNFINASWQGYYVTASTRI